MTIQNVTMRSIGTGTSQRHSLMFKADSGLTNISLASFNESQTVFRWINAKTARSSSDFQCILRPGNAIDG
ncbi:hypothetical protein RJ639_029192 [Escallonia herrerae]|uniref:Uncharacterized protein n=1 Tax=Escallonia herrerae TaxID=1293975 RepID=A0AA88X6H8_9ASTE|nr:hypothetical protein RJ639_029192 [Escallonia herrerae]